MAKFGCEASLPGFVDDDQVGEGSQAQFSQAGRSQSPEQAQGGADTADLAADPRRAKSLAEVAEPEAKYPGRGVSSGGEDTANTAELAVPEAKSRGLGVSSGLCATIWEDTDSGWERTHEFNTGLELDCHRSRTTDDNVCVHLPVLSLRALQHLRNSLHELSALHMDLPADRATPSEHLSVLLAKVAFALPPAVVLELQQRFEARAAKTAASPPVVGNSATLVRVEDVSETVDLFVCPLEACDPSMLPVITLARLTRGSEGSTTLLQCIGLVVGPAGNPLTGQVGEALASSLTDDDFATALRRASAKSPALVQAFDRYLSTLSIMPNVHMDSGSEHGEHDEPSTACESRRDSKDLSQGEDALLSDQLAESIERMMPNAASLSAAKNQLDKIPEHHSHRRCFVEVGEVSGHGDGGLWRVTHRLRQGLELDVESNAASGRDRLHLPRVSVLALGEMQQLLMQPGSIALNVAVDGAAAAADAAMHVLKLAGLHGSAHDEVTRALLDRLVGVEPSSAEKDLASQACDILVKAQSGDEVCHVLVVSCKNFVPGRSCVGAFLQLESPLSFCFPNTPAPARLLLILAGPENERKSLAILADSFAALTSDEDLFWDLATAADSKSFVDAVEARLDRLVVVPHTRLNSHNGSTTESVTAKTHTLTQAANTSSHQDQSVGTKVEAWQEGQNQASMKKQRSRIALVTQKAVIASQKYAIPLVLGVFIALVWSNVDKRSYHLVTHTGISDWAIFGHPLSMHFVVNDVFMCFFFGLAIKEVTEAVLPGGSLNPPRRAVNPLFATVGGVAGPIAVYLVAVMVLQATGAFDNITCTSSVAEDHRRLASDTHPEDARLCSLDMLLKGWGVPTATDISLAWMFAIQIFGVGHPAINFLLLLAIVDDAIGMVIIAAAYPDPTHPVEPIWLLLVLLAMVLAFALRRCNVSYWSAYVILCGPVSWLGLIKARVHPALSLVVVVPFMPAWNGHEEHHTKLHDDVDLAERSASFNGHVKLAKQQAAAFLARYHSSEAPLHTFEHGVKAPIDFGMFFFGLCNAGVPLNQIGGITFSVLFALVVGKTLGIAGFSLLAHAMGFTLPPGLSKIDLFAMSALGGVGLTVALFVANEAFSDPGLQGQAKFAAVLSVGCAFVAWALRKIGQAIERSGGKAAAVAAGLPPPDASVPSFPEDTAENCYVDELLVEEIMHILWLQRRYRARGIETSLERLTPISEPPSPLSPMSSGPKSTGSLADPPNAPAKVAGLHDMVVEEP